MGRLSPRETGAVKIEKTGSELASVTGADDRRFAPGHASGPRADPARGTDDALAAGPRTLAIRPERVRLSEVPAENSLRCRIVEVRFRGEHWEYLADTPLGGVRGLAATAPVQGGATNVVLPDAALFPVA